MSPAPHMQAMQQMAKGKTGNGKGEKGNGIVVTRQSRGRRSSDLAPSALPIHVSRFPFPFSRFTFPVVSNKAA